MGPSEQVHMAQMGDGVLAAAAPKADLRQASVVGIAQTSHARASARGISGRRAGRLSSQS
jgi:hypothetical protein